MYSELLKAFQSNKNCSFYTDDECDKFIYGKVIALNEDEVAIQMYNTDGTCDGVIVKTVSDFFRIEYDSKYNQKMVQIRLLIRGALCFLKHFYKQTQKILTNCIYTWVKPQKNWIRTRLLPTGIKKLP